MPLVVSLESVGKKSKELLPAAMHNLSRPSTPEKKILNLSFFLPFFPINH
jgi:hypothetical protein